VSAADVLAELHGELTGVEGAIRRHRFLDAADEGSVPEHALAAFAGEQYAILRSDRRSFAQLASRFPSPPAGDLFLHMAGGEGEALSRLLDFAAALGLDEATLAAHEPEAGCQAYPAFVSWLALNGSRADVAIAFLANLAAWGESCGRLAAALRGAYGLDDRAVGFFDFFATADPGFERLALAVADSGLAEGDSRVGARRAARLLQAYELLYWDTCGGQLQR